MAKRKLKMTKACIAARKRYRRKRTKRGGAIIGATAFGPWGWLLPF